MSDSSGPPPASPQESTDAVLQSYIKNLPGLYNVTGAGTPALAQGELAAAQQTTPGYNQLALDQTKQFALPFAQLQAGNNASLLAGSGGDVARNAKLLSDSVNPEYAALRSNITGQAGNLLNSINLNGLSGGERSEVERSLGRSNYATGNLGLDNATNAVSNAMVYGDRLSQKRNELGQAIGAGIGAMGTQDQSFNPVAIALGGPAGTATGFTPVANSNAGTNASQFGSGTMGNLTDISNNQNQLGAQYNWQSSDRWRMNQIGSNMCCFILLECTNGVLPWYVRVERDKYYHQEPLIATGYKRMAKWLVPLMQQYPLLKSLVNTLMVKPIISYGAHTHKVNKYGHIFWPIKKLWFTIWKLTGRSN